MLLLCPFDFELSLPVNLLKDQVNMPQVRLSRRRAPAESSFRLVRQAQLDIPAPLLVRHITSTVLVARSYSVYVRAVGILAVAHLCRSSLGGLTATLDVAT